MKDQEYLGLKLHDAVNMGDIDAVVMCLADGVDINTKDALGNTPLLAAAYTSQASMAKMLLAHGADPTTIGFMGLTAHDLAVKMGFMDVAESFTNNKNELCSAREICNKVGE